MKILVLAPQWPDPARQGAAIRNLQILLHLAQWHEVYLLTFTAEQMQMDHLQSVCVRAEALPAPSRSKRTRLQQLATSSLPDMAWRLHSEEMESQVRQLCREVEFDAIHIEGIEMAAYGLLAQDLLLPTNPALMLVYDAHNAEYRLQQRAFNTDIADARRIPRALYSLAQWQRLHTFECKLCLACTGIVAVSKADKIALSKLAPEKQDSILVLPNGVDVDYWSRNAEYERPQLPEGDTIAFDGTMDFRPNVDAVTYFAREVWPIIRKERPRARFYIVGRNPAPDVQALANREGITVTGAVDDTRGWVAGATVYVVPVRMGGGVRLKVLQAMAMGCAIVSTPMGVEGIAARHEREVLVARNRGQFAHTVLQLLDSPGIRADLGSAARQLVSAHYAWDKLLRTLNDIYPATLRLTKFVEDMAMPGTDDISRQTSEADLQAANIELTGSLFSSNYMSEALSTNGLYSSTGELHQTEREMPTQSFPDDYRVSLGNSLPGETRIIGVDDLGRTTWIPQGKHASEGLHSDALNPAFMRDDLPKGVTLDQYDEDFEVDIFDPQRVEDETGDLDSGPPTVPDLTALPGIEDIVADQDAEQATASIGEANLTPTQMPGFDDEGHSIFSDKERADIEAVLASFRAVARYRISLEELLNQWTRFVEEVEQGYNATIFNYTSELGTRDLLASISSQVPTSVRRKLVSIINPLDARLILATREVDDELPGHPEEDIGTWWYRIPTVLRNPDYPKLTFWLRNYSYRRQGFDTWFLT